MILIVMGVSASGKSTIGRLLAQTLNWGFIEGDELHPSVNIQKMSQGQPLSDSDRWPWLDAIRQLIDQLAQHDKSAVITCSALKQSYRDYLCQHHASEVQFIYLKSDPQTLQSRIAQRSGHFMKAGLLQSQLDTLEEPQEAAIVIAVDNSMMPAEVVQTICTHLPQTPSG